MRSYGYIHSLVFRSVSSFIADLFLHQQGLAQEHRVHEVNQLGDRIFTLDPDHSRVQWMGLNNTVDALLSVGEAFNI